MITNPKFEVWLDQLIQDLCHGDRAARLDATESLTVYGLPIRRALPALAELLADPDPVLALSAADAMFCADTTGKYVEAIFDKRPLDDATFEKLLLELKHDQPVHRRRAAFELGMYRTRATKAIPALSEVVQDRYPSVASAAVAALNRIDPSGSAVKATGYHEMTVEEILTRPPEHWVNVLKHGVEVGQKLGAAYQLGCKGAAAGEAGVDVLMDALLDENDDLRHCAAQSLGWVGAVAAKAIPRILELLSKEQSWSFQFRLTKTLEHVRQHVAAAEQMTPPHGDAD